MDEMNGRRKGLCTLVPSNCLVGASSSAWLDNQEFCWKLQQGSCALYDPQERCFALNSAASALVKTEVLRLRSGACITTVLHCICLVDKQSSLSEVKTAPFTSDNLMGIIFGMS